MGNSSCQAMLISGEDPSCWCGVHLPLNQCGEKRLHSLLTQRHQWLETKFEQGEKGGKKRLTPFHEARKCAHISRSLQNSFQTRIKAQGLDKRRVSDIMHLRKGRPGATTLHAKCSDPMSDCRSRRRQLVLDCQAETSE